MAIAILRCFPEANGYMPLSVRLLWVPSVSLCNPSAAHGSCQLYASCLAVISVSAKPRWSRLVTRHINAIMLTLFGVYVYRDLWPMATFSLNPKDVSEGPILIAKAIVLFITAVGVPLLIPRQYVAVDPKVESSLVQHPVLDSHVSVGSNGCPES
jgi:hypothetical protein